MTAYLSSSINPLHFGARTSVARSFCVIRIAIFNYGCVQRVLRVGVTD